MIVYAACYTDCYHEYGPAIFSLHETLVDAFDLDQDDMMARIKYKTESMATWERLIKEEQSNQDGWKIDHSAGRPILMKNQCSVIEAEDADYILSLILADQNKPDIPHEDN